MTNLYNENFISAKKENDKDTGIWKDLPSLGLDKINIVKKITSQKQFPNSVHSQSTASSHSSHKEKKILKFIWNNKRLGMANQSYINIQLFLSARFICLRPLTVL